MLGIRLFPQVLSDLNFFNVNSPKELAFRLRTVQRVAVAAIGGYLLLRYERTVIKQLGLKCPLSGVVRLGFLAGNAYLSVPMAALSMTAIGSYQCAMKVVPNYRDKKIGWLVFNVGMVFYGYILSQFYKDLEIEISPNLLERLFQKVEDKLTQPLWDRFYKA